MKALEYYLNKYNCAESVFKSHEKKIDSSIATPFGGGIGKTNQICGALTGGLMVLGIKHGRKTNSESQEKAQQVSKKLIEEFTEEFRATTCDDLTGCDLSSEEGQEKFKLPERKEKCKSFVEFVDKYVGENS